MKKLDSNFRTYHEWTTDFCEALESEHKVPPDCILGEYAILKLTDRYMRIKKRFIGDWTPKLFERDGRDDLPPPPTADW